MRGSGEHASSTIGAHPLADAYSPCRRCVYELAYFCKLHKGDLSHRLLLLSLDWPSTLSPLKAKGLSREEEARFRDFSCLKAQCYKPSDRAMLLEWIRVDWGSEEAFDDFVRTELLQVMRKSKARYFARIREVVVAAFELVFGD